ncbi:MAG: ABC transporter permease subunit, partial [Candidatus Aminicenantes bacterium]|nr:ABC transporter permease subunit [Candidatus Aminicenantes bacterium]
MKINKNIYSMELRLNRNSFLIWSIMVAVVVVLGMAFFPVLNKGGMLQQMTALFENPFMKTIMTAFGATLDVLTNPLGFYATRNALFIMLLGGFFSFLLAGRIVAREEGEKSAEFLLTRPVTRTEVVWSKLAAFLTYLIGFNGAFLLVGFLSLEAFKGEGTYSLAAFFIYNCYIFLLTLTFGAVGLAISLWIRRGRSIATLSTGIIVGSYFIETLSKITPGIDKIGYISPFKFVDSGVLRPDYVLEWWRVAYFVGLTVLLVALSVIKYRK